MAYDTGDADLQMQGRDLVRTAFGLGGIVAIVIGLLILIWPGHTASAVTAIIALYAVIVGLVYLALGLFARTSSGWGRIGHLALGAAFVVAGVIAFFNLDATRDFLAAFLGIFIGILWIVQGALSLVTLGSATSKTWTTVFAVLSIVAGVVLVMSPLWGFAVLWWLVGISLLVLGIIQVVRAITFRTA